MRTIKISFLSALLCLISHVCFAQAYEYGCMKHDGEIYECLMTKSYGQDKLMFSLSSKSNLNTVFSITGLSFLTYLTKEKENILKLFLSNGEILTGKYSVEEATLWFRIGTHNFLSNKVNISVENKRMAYVMKQLRKFNITKISINGKIVSTPNFRSAATIDAMCKTLISKTGDQGQYGSTNTSSTSPGASSSTRSTGNCPDGNHPHLIDLGLPSGTKWACCNVGANKPESSGEYYSWGEVVTKYRYNYKTYLHYSNGRYINIGTDISGSRYDAAHVEWGGNWRMPTYNEAKELINNCTYEWTVLNGVKGGKFTSKINGKSIFLPASGLRGDSGLEEQGVYGYCWSGTLNSNDDTHAYYLGCNSTNAFCNYWIRPCGHPVRPVRKN